MDCTRETILRCNAGESQAGEGGFALLVGDILPSARATTQMVLNVSLKLTELNRQNDTGPTLFLT